MNYEELDFDRAIDDANKIVLLGSAMKIGLFSSLTKEKDIPSLTRELELMSAPCISCLRRCGQWDTWKIKTTGISSPTGRPLFIEGGKDYLGGYLPHALNKLNAFLEK